MLNNQFINIGTNRARYWEAGTTGSFVVLLHGIGCSVLEWAHNIEVIARSHRVIALDLLGHGLTDKPSDDRYTLRSHSEFILKFMEAKGVACAHLVGNSLGGRLALECAILAPDRVSSITLVDPAGMAVKGPLFDFRLATLPLIGEILTWPNKIGMRMLWRKAFFKPDRFVTDELVATKVMLAQQKGSQSAFLKTLRGFLNVWGFRPELVQQLYDALPALHVPILVFWGKQDLFVPPAHAEVLRAKVHHLHVEILDQCGHAPQVECADRFNQRSLEFWNGIK